MLRPLGKNETLVIREDPYPSSREYFYLAIWNTPAPFEIIHYL